MNDDVEELREKVNEVGYREKNQANTKFLKKTR